MKKIGVACGILVLLLAGCGQDAPVRVEDHTWQLTTLQSRAEDGQIIARGPGAGQSDTAEELDLTCTALDGVLTLIDATHDRTGTGSYQQVEATPQTVTYQVSVEEREGMAAASVTVQADGQEIPTLILQLDDYTLNFCPADAEPRQNAAQTSETG